jgi:hypothetical protein
MHSTKRDVDTFIQKFENSRISSLTFKLICLICCLKIQFSTIIAMFYIEDQYSIPQPSKQDFQLHFCIQRPRSDLTASSQHHCGILAASSQRPHSVLLASSQHPRSVLEAFKILFSVIFVYLVSSQHPCSVLAASSQRPKHYFRLHLCI